MSWGRGKRGKSEFAWAHVELDVPLGRPGGQAQQAVGGLGLNLGDTPPGDVNHPVQALGCVLGEEQGARDGKLKNTHVQRWAEEVETKTERGVNGRRRRKRPGYRRLIDVTRAAFPGARRAGGADGEMQATQHYGLCSISA